MDYRLEDLIDIEQFQMLQDRLNEIYSFPSAIVDNDGNVLTATGWQDVCTKFHRQHDECRAECLKSDRYIHSHLREANPAVSYRCPHGLIDNATPILVDGHHLGNFFTGQFFLEAPDLDFFRAQAQRYGFDADSYLEAVKAVPIWSESQLASYLFFIKGLIEVISSIGLKNLRALEANEKVADSESQFRVMFENASLGMTQADPNTGRWLRVNQRMCEITGYSAEELLAKSVPDITHPDDRQADRQAYEQAVRSEVPDYRLEKRYIRKDGAVVWVNVNIAVIRNAAGQAVRTMASIEDITERKRAEAALRLSEARLVRAQSVAHVGNWELDLVTGQMWASAEAFRLYGLDHTSALLLPQVQRLAHADDRPRMDAALRGLVEAGAPYDEEYRITRANDGVERVMHTLGELVRDAHGTPLQVIGVIQDITESKQAELALRRSDALLRGIIDNLQDAYVRADAAHAITMASPSAARFFGYYSADEMIGLPVAALYADEADHRAIAEQLARLGYVSDYVGQARRRDGSTVWGSLNAQLFLDAQGNLQAMEAVVRDITERRQAEEALRASETRFRAVFENSVDAIGVSRAGHHAFVNPAYVALFGYDNAEELVGSAARDLIAPDEQERIADLVRRRRAGEIVTPYIETCGLRRDGSPFDMDMHISAFEVDGESMALIVLRDITERKQAAEALRATEERLGLALDAAKLGTWDWDIASGGFVWSPQMHALLGTDPESRTDLFGVWRQAVHPEDIELANQRIEQALGDHARLDSDYRVVWPDGQVRWINALGHGYYDDHGQPTRMVGFLRDITEEKQAEEALRSSEELFRGTFTEAATGMALVALGGYFVQVNPAFCRFLGYTEHELLGKAVADITAPDDLDTTAQVIERAIGAGTSVKRHEKRYLTKSGQMVWGEVSIAPLRNAHGDVICLVAHVNDVTERRQAEEALREGEARARAMYDAIPDLMFRMDRHGVFLDYKADVTDLHAQSLPSLVGHRNRDLTPPDFADLIDERIHATLTTGEMCTFEYTMPIPGRGDRNYEARMVPSGPDEVLAMVRDVTDRTRADEERDQLTAQLAQAQKMESVGRLAGGVAHDFNNMLSVILGHIEFALDGTEPEHPLHEDLASIQDAALRSADLTAQLLAFARKQTVAPQVLDLNDTVAGLLKMVVRLIGEDIELSWRPAAELWPVRMDPSQMDQILTNLCINARDAIAGVGRIGIETGNIAVDADLPAAHSSVTAGDYVRLVLSDTGCGMDEATLAHVFEPFYTTKGQGHGTGLGLATVYGIVKQNGGFIDVTSEPNGGARFTIYLPRYTEAAVLMPTEDPAERVAGGQATILLVEDEPGVLRLTVRQLQRQGYTVLSAGTPADAMRLASDHAGQIDLLLTDVIMPEMNGRDLAAALLERHPHLKCLYMSGYTADIITSQGVLADDVHFLEKPFSGWALAAKVAEALRGD